MEVKKWLESVLLPTLQEQIASVRLEIAQVRTEMTQLKGDVKNEFTEVRSDLAIIKKDVSHLEKQMLLSFDHVNLRLTHLEAHAFDPSKSPSRFGDVKNA